MFYVWASCHTTDINTHGLILSKQTWAYPRQRLQQLLWYVVSVRFNLTETGLTFNNCTLCPHCIYVFCIYLRTNNDLCHLEHKLIGFYNRDGKCLQRGTDWGFK